MAISITKPTIGGSEDSWGTTINTALDDIVLEINSNADGTNTITPNLGTGWEINGTAVSASANDLNNIPSTLTDLGITDGSNGQVLQTNGSGTFSFITLPTGSTDTNYYVTGGSYSSGTLTLTRNGGLSNVSISGLPAAITDNSQIGNGAGYVTSSAVPTNNNQLTNGAGYITSATPPTTAGAVGTYSFGRPANRNTSYAAGTTSTSFYSVQMKGPSGVPRYTQNGWENANATLQSGTWRSMSGAISDGGAGYCGIWVRIS
jgi:hypothetical protein